MKRQISAFAKDSRVMAAPASATCCTYADAGSGAGSAAQSVSRNEPLAACKLLLVAEHLYRRYVDGRCCGSKWWLVADGKHIGFSQQHSSGLLCRSEVQMGMQWRGLQALQIFSKGRLVRSLSSGYRGWLPTNR